MSKTAPQAPKDEPVIVPLKSNRPYKLIVWGATGFTGQLVCQHIANDYTVRLVAISVAQLCTMLSTTSKLCILSVLPGRVRAPTAGTGLSLAWPGGESSLAAGAT